MECFQNVERVPLEGLEAPNCQDWVKVRSRKTAITSVLKIES